MAIKTDIRSAYLSRTSHGISPTGIKLPPSPFRIGGRHFQSDTNFVDQAKNDIARLVQHGYSPDRQLLDWGCGAGRLAVGALETWPDFANYDGVDVQKHLIDWALRHIERPGVTFTWVDVSNARYNPKGDRRCVIPGNNSRYAAIYAYSVFSHMVSADVQAYLFEFKRLLATDGFALVTAFIETDVADEAENPEGYGPLAWRGPLHCVRFSHDRFESMVRQAGLYISRWVHGGDTDGQSALVLRHAEL